ncbi:MAG: hypothetical protein AAB692_05370 [Patescibacteria group bacterium]
MSDKPFDLILPQNTPVIIIGFGPPEGSAHYNPFFGEPVRMSVIQLPDPFRPPNRECGFVCRNSARLFVLTRKTPDQFGATLTFMLEDKKYVFNAFGLHADLSGDDHEFYREGQKMLYARAKADVEDAFREHGENIFPLLK